MRNSSSELPTNCHVCSYEAAVPLPAATTASVLVGFRLDLNELPKLGGEENHFGVSILDDEKQQPPLQSHSMEFCGTSQTFSSKTVQLNAAVFSDSAPLRSSAASQVSPLFFPPWTGFRPWGRRQWNNVETHDVWKQRLLQCRWYCSAYSSYQLAAKVSSALDRAHVLCTTCIPHHGRRMNNDCHCSLIQQINCLKIMQVLAMDHGARRQPRRHTHPLRLLSL